MKAFWALMALVAGLIASPTGAQATTRALIVGIATYQHADGNALANLKGPVNDAEAISRLLQTRFQVSPENITLLRDAQAKRAALLAELKRVLVTAPSPGDLSLFYYAGHGSRVYDGSIDETSQYDDTLVPYDARGPGAGGSLDITDDELGALVRAGAAKGVRIVVILDSCHSATALRLTARSRGADPAARTVSTPRTTPPRRLRDVARNRAVLLAAAQDREQAIEALRNGAVRGEFTRALVAVLERAEPEVTYQDVLTRTRVGMRSVGATQEPQSEGDIGQRFLGTGPTARPSLSAEPSANGRLRLSVGSLAGVTLGSRYAIYPTAGAAAAGGAPLSEAEVVTLAAASAELKPQRAQVWPSQLFAVERLHDFGTLRLQLGLRGGSSAERATLLKALGALPFVQPLAPEPTFWLEIAEGKVALLRSDASRLGPVTALGPKLEPGLERTLARLMRFQGLLALSNPRKPQSPIRAQVVLEGDGPGNRRAAETHDGEPRLKAGEHFLLNLFNASAGERPYVYVVNFASDLDITLLRPPPGGVDEPLIGLVETEVYEAPPDPGQEVFMVLATQSPIDLAGLEQSGGSESTFRSGPRRLANPLAQYLWNANALDRAATPDLPLDGWSPTFVTVTIGKPPASAAPSTPRPARPPPAK